MLTRRMMLAGSVVTGSVAIAPMFAFSVSDMAEASERRINLAGRERTLIEQAAKAACFVHLGIEPERHVAEMRKDHEQFEKVLLGLRFGDPELGLQRETDDAVLAALAKVKQKWFPYSEALAGPIETGTVARADLDAILAHDLEVLGEMDRTVGLIQRAYGGRDVPLHIAVQVNIAGRQRTLSQQMAKQLCMIVAGYDEEASRAALAETVTLFDNSLSALSNGMPMLGIQAPKTDALKAQFGVVAARWAEMRAVLDPVLAGGAVEREMLAGLPDLTGTLLDASDTAVGLYAAES